MIRSVILLCPHADARHLSGALTLHNPALTVTTVETREALDLAVARAEPGTRLIAFLTRVVVPPEALARLGVPAYNFHPAPPAYPGKHPLGFALYEGAESYGATAHEMTMPVDSGPIVGTVEFALPPGAPVNWIKERAYEAMIRLFLLLAPKLATTPEPLPRLPAGWSPRRCSGKALDRLCDLPPDIEEAELERRIRAFVEGECVPLHMTVHGRRFVLAP